MKGDTVLILASLDDLHAQSVAHILNTEFDVSSIIWDNSSIPVKDTASLVLTQDTTEFQIETSTRSISFSSLRSIWWRRPSVYQISEEVKDPTIKEFCLLECSAFFRGALDSMDIPVINSPTAIYAAIRKPFQLKLAQSLGLKIPRTIMSNNPRDILSFWEGLGRNCIYKPFTQMHGQMAETRILMKEDLKDLNRLRHAPLIVQEKITKGLDIRVNIFGETVFAAEAVINNKAAELDWRLDFTATWKEHILPDEIIEKLIKLLRKLGLHYGCIDLIQNPDGTYVFLEVNESGQFLFIEVETRQPLLRAMANLLIQPDVIDIKKT